MSRQEIIQNAKQMSDAQKKIAFASEYEAQTPAEMAAKSERSCKCITKMQQKTTLAIKQHLAGDKEALKRAPLFLG